MNFKQIFYFFVGMLILLLASDITYNTDHIIPIFIVIVSVFYLLYTEIFKNTLSIKSILIGVSIAWLIYHFVNI
ncbi:hypothetical protein CW357_17440 [Rummeliibacillus sp. TYF005]|mgnify:CR=1 FL=1|nr:hypothetical protein D1606_17790 [Rummeliibacillus sp. POC4]RPJ94048.1 hypothetical protein CW357_17440 [Rummeliibacillus sp. TYF005]